MRLLSIGIAALLFGLLLGAAPTAPAGRAHADTTVEVTSTGDSGDSLGAICPHVSLCTLRRAIELANADLGSDPFIITFSSAVFPAIAPATVPVGGLGLPTVARANVTIDGSGAGVSLTGGSTSLTAVINGLTASGAGFTVSALHVHGFSGSCISATGPGSSVGGPNAGDGNVLGGCKTGVAVSGEDATVQGNLIGFARDGSGDSVETGVLVAAGGALIGGPFTSPEAPNRIGFAETAVYVGGGSAPFSGVVVERNFIGTRPSTDEAAVSVGIRIAPPANGTAVLANIIDYAGDGIVVSPDSGTASSTGNRLAQNVFEHISGFAIDLGADGARNPNDPGDTDTGPNTLLNHPVISRVTQSRLTGIACAGCSVQVYLAAHTPGARGDYGRAPLPGGTVTADAAGSFAIDSPAAAPGDWLVALATDAGGNTSEFGAPMRMGVGAVLCGNVQLQPGWNHLGYFGAEPVALFSTFAPDPAGSITAIYRQVDGSDTWERWFSTTSIGRTLGAVQPGESYWFFATAPVTLPGGFSISAPLPVQLRAGPNDFVYLGATAHVLDALSSLASDFSGLYRYHAAASSWRRYGDPSIPSWAQDFTQLEACATYSIRLDVPATLVPLQP